jgi:hypothetical protein
LEPFGGEATTIGLEGFADVALEHDRFGRGNFNDLEAEEFIEVTRTIVGCDELTLQVTIGGAIALDDVDGVGGFVNGDTVENFGFDDDIGVRVGGRLGFKGEEFGVADEFDKGIVERDGGAFVRSVGPEDAFRATFTGVSDLADGFGGRVVGERPCKGGGAACNGIDSLAYSVDEEVVGVGFARVVEFVPVDVTIGEGNFVAEIVLRGGEFNIGTTEGLVGFEGVLDLVGFAVCCWWDEGEGERVDGGNALIDERWDCEVATRVIRGTERGLCKKVKRTEKKGPKERAFHREEALMGAHDVAEIEIGRENLDGLRARG